MKNKNMNFRIKIKQTCLKSNINKNTTDYQQIRYDKSLKD